MTVQKIFVNNNLYDVSNLNENSDFIKYHSDDQEVKMLIYNGMLCNDTKIAENGTLTGDPTETALVDIALKLGFTKNVYDKLPRVDEIPFDSERKLMTTVHENNGKYIVYTKGGVDELLNICTSYMEDDGIKEDLENYKLKITDMNEKMAQDALRVLAFGYKELDHKPQKKN